jgi:hypothetical protein
MQPSSLINKKGCPNLRGALQLFTNAVDVVSCVVAIDFKSMTSMRSLYRGVLLGAYLQRRNQHRYRASTFFYPLCRETAREAVGQAICPAFDPTE